MCKNSPCIPTPDEVVRIIDAGYYKDMAVTTVLIPGQAYQCVMPKAVKDTSSETGERCVFLDHRGLCALHDKGLKPIEGRFALCGTTTLDSIKLRYMVLKTWADTALGKSILAIASEVKKITHG